MEKILEKNAWRVDMMASYVNLPNQINNRPPVRPLRYRIVCAVFVLFGYADAAYWPGVQRRFL